MAGNRHLLFGCSCWIIRCFKELTSRTNNISTLLPPLFISIFLPQLFIKALSFSFIAFSILNRVDFYNRQLPQVLHDKLKIFVLTEGRKLNNLETDEKYQQIASSSFREAILLPSNKAEMIHYISHYKMPNNTTVNYIESAKDKPHTRATTASTFIEFKPILRGT